MEVAYQCNADDYVEAQRAHALKIWVVYIPLMLGILFFALGVWQVFSVGFARAVPALVLGALWMWLFRSVFGGKRLQRDFQKHAHLGKESRLRIDDEGISITNDVSSASNRWALYSSFRETNSLFVLYQGPRLFEMIPKRAFGDADLPRFRDLLTQEISKPK